MGLEINATALNTAPELNVTRNTADSAASDQTTNTTAGSFREHGDLLSTRRAVTFVRTAWGVSDPPRSGQWVRVSATEGGRSRPTHLHRIIRAAAAAAQSAAPVMSATERNASRISRLGVAAHRAEPRTRIVLAAAIDRPRGGRLRFPPLAPSSAPGILSSLSARRASTRRESPGIGAINWLQKGGARR
jgi:hypothetical protein